MIPRPRSAADTTAELFFPFPGSPDLAHVALPVDETRSLNAADLRTARNADFGLPWHWFSRSERHCYDLPAGRRWIYAYIEQTRGPFLTANFMITRDRTGYVVRLDDGVKITAQWGSLTTITAVTEAIREHVGNSLRRQGLGVLG